MSLVVQRLRRVVRRHRAWLNPLASSLAPLPFDVERRLRRGLRLARDVATVFTAPSGADLPQPLRMYTLGGREQIATNLSHFGWSRWERALSRALEAALVATGPDTAFLDVGANSGVYALLAKALQPYREVHAFEPYPPAAELLRRNIALNAFAESVVTRALALSSRGGELDLYVPDISHGFLETSASLRADFRDHHSDVVKIQAITLDAYATRLAGRVGVIKIDVEGAESEVIRGAGEVLARDQPIVFFEALPETGTWDAIVEVLRPLGYSTYAVTDPGLRPIETATPDASNYVALLEAKPTHRSVAVSFA